MRVNWFIVVVAVTLATSCGGGGCGGCGTMQPIPGGFAPAKRNANAGQLRVSQSGLAAITSNPGAIIGGVLGGGSNGTIDFNVPASCGGRTPGCCPGGTAQNPCGPIDIDLSLHAGDTPRLVLAPKQGGAELDVTLRARIKSAMPLPVTVPVVGDCTVAIDTTPGPTPDVQIDMPITFQQDPTAGTTRVVVGTVALTNLTSDDVSLGGSIACDIASLGLSFFIGTLSSALTSQIQSTIQDQTCKKCPTGTLDECGPFATACTNNVCEEGSACLQELGIDGRMLASSLFSSLSPGTTGALDLYEVAGGYGTTDNNGIALGLLGGMEPGGTPRDACGPMAAEPAQMPIPQSPFFEGNTRPDTGEKFDVAIGLHQSQLGQFAYAGYDGGLLCLTIGHDTVSQLDTDTIGLLSRSLGKLVEKDSPVALGLRPQSAPVIGLGKNTFDGTGALTDPLIDVKFSAMEIDFFASIDDHYVRLFTVVADVHLPVGLQVGAAGELTPVLGDVADAFTNVSVKNDVMAESPDDLAMLFPTLLNLVLPQLSNGLPAIKLPSIGGLNLTVNEITSVPTTVGGSTNDFLAIFANLALPSSFTTSVRTRADVIDVRQPTAEILKSPRLWKTTEPPAIALALGGDASDLEWQIRLDGGFWQPWSRNPTPTLHARSFLLAGVHHIDVRARRIGQPDSVDPEPVSLAVEIGEKPAAGANFHGQGDGMGCQCDGGGNAVGGVLLVLMIVVLLIPRRWWRRTSRVVMLAAIAVLPGCSCGNSKPCGDQACMSGDVAHGPLGRWTSIAGDDQRVMVATYDNQLGDLVAVDVTNPSSFVPTAVDGIPSGATPTHDPSGYRGGVDDPGPDVGAWTSIVLSNHIARVAYQDRDAFALKYAFETAPGSWSSYVIDAGMGEQVGDYAAMVIDGSGNPAIAYLGVGVDDGMNHKVTELRVARATSATPTTESEWMIAKIATKPGSCAGLCSAGDACIAATTTDPQTCIMPTTDCGSACSMTQACSMGACIDTVADDMLDVPPLGTGLYVSLVVLPDGRLAATYYDQSQLSLVLATESAANSNMCAETVLDGGPTTDVGMWTSAAVASDGTIHIAYQDTLGDQQLYTTVSSSGTQGRRRGRRRRRAHGRSPAQRRRVGVAVSGQRLAGDRVPGRPRLRRLPRDPRWLELDDAGARERPDPRRVLDRRDDRARHAGDRVGIADARERSARRPRRAVTVTRAALLVVMAACGGAHDPAMPDNRGGSTALSKDDAVFEAVILHDLGATKLAPDEAVCVATRGATTDGAALLAAIQSRYPTAVRDSACRGGGPDGPVVLAASGLHAVRIDIGPITWVGDIASIASGGAYRGGGVREVEYIVEHVGSAWQVTSEKPLREM